MVSVANNGGDDSIVDHLIPTQTNRNDYPNQKYQQQQQQQRWEEDTSTRSSRHSFHSLDERDHGHRHGNFPNYSTFHPPHARMQILESNGILDHIRRGLSIFVVNDDDEDDDDDGTDNHQEDEKKYHHRPKRQRFVRTVKDKDDTSLEAKASLTKNNLHDKNKKHNNSNSNSNSNSNIIYYCDLGCNSGELTMAMAESLLLLDGINCRSSETTMMLHVLGLDLDPRLVERANNNKYGLTTSHNTQKDIIRGDNNVARMIKTTFMVCDLNSESEHNTACTDYFATMNVDGIEHGKTESITTGTGTDGGGDNDRSGKDIIAYNSNGKRQSLADTPSYVSISSLPIPKLLSSSSLCHRPLFHLTTIFSTTMWIHVHGGDDGLQSFLERACHWTAQYLLIEPQPSGCYRKANIRLRKMGRPELADVTSDRLTLRTEIEKEIEFIITQCGFRRVTTNCVSEVDSNCEAITAWNRSLRLYERVQH